MSLGSRSLVVGETEESASEIDMELIRCLGIDRPNRKGDEEEEVITKITLHGLDQGVLRVRELSAYPKACGLARKR